MSEVEHVECSRDAIVATTPLPALVPSHSTIDDKSEHDYFCQQYYMAHALPSSITHFAGASPRSLERSHLENICAEECAVLFKTDGVRMSLLMTTDQSGAPIALMINRAMVMYEVEVHAHAKFFRLGTLLDGELVWEYVNYVPQLRFLIFDVVRVAGALQSHLDYTMRIQSITHRISNADVTDATLIDTDSIRATNNEHNLMFQVKQFWRFDALRRMWQQRNECFHRNDGLIFILTRHALEINTAQKTYKWKGLHTIDVTLRKQEDGSWTAFAYSGRIDRVGRRKVVVQPNEVVDKVVGKVVECTCQLNDSEALLIPLKIRLDKLHGNSVHTIERTFVNIEEAIGIDELLRASDTTISR